MKNINFFILKTNFFKKPKITRLLFVYFVDKLNRFENNNSLIAKIHLKKKFRSNFFNKYLKNSNMTSEIRIVIF